MNWISVKERLPEDHQIVMVWRNDGFPLAVRYRVDHYYGGFRHGLYAIYTTHWMPVTNPVEDSSSPQVTPELKAVDLLRRGILAMTGSARNGWADDVREFLTDYWPVGSEVEPRTPPEDMSSEEFSRWREVKPRTGDKS